MRLARAKGGTILVALVGATTVAWTFVRRAPLSGERPIGLRMTMPHQAIPVEIRVDARRELGPFPEVWRFFGADEPNYATMPNGRRLIGELGSLRPKEVYFRTHNLLTTGD